MGNFWASTNRSTKLVINEKIRVLRDFCIVDDSNEIAIRNRLLAEINSNPDKDPDIIADRIARRMISDKLTA